MGICGVHDTILPFYVFEISYNKKKIGKGEKQDIRISLTEKVTFAVECSACIGPLLPSGIKILKKHYLGAVID